LEKNYEVRNCGVMEVILEFLVRSNFRCNLKTMVKIKETRRIRNIGMLMKIFDSK